MARLFDDAATEYLSVDAAAVTAYPLTMACWFRSDDATLAQCLMSICDKDALVNSFGLFISGDVAGDPLRARAEDSGGSSNASTTTGYSANTWHHGAGVMTSATSRSAYIDGGSVATSTVSRTPINLDRTAIGALAESTVTFPSSARIAEAAIWNIALTADQVAQLARGINPQRIRRDALVGYWPLFGTGSPEPNLVGNTALNLTLTGTVVADGPPRMMAPFGFWLGWDGAFTAVAVAGQPTMRRWGHVLHMPTAVPRMAGIR